MTEARVYIKKENDKIVSIVPDTFLAIEIFLNEKNENLQIGIETSDGISYISKEAGKKVAEALLEMCR